MKALRRSVLAVGLIAATLAGAYAAVLAVYASDSPIRTPTPNPVDYFRDENSVSEVDPRWGVMNRRNFSYARTVAYPGYSLSFDIHYDDVGARVDSAGMKRKGANAVLCGESSAWGYGLENEKTFASVLGKAMDWDVANVSVPGHTGVQCLHQFTRLIAQGFKPRWLVYFMWQEHLASNVSRCAAVSGPICLPLDRMRRNAGGEYVVEWVPPADMNAARRDFNRFMRETMDNPGRESTLLTDMYWYHKAWMARALKSRGDGAATLPLDLLPASCALLAEMDALARRAGARLLVAYIPFYFEGKVEPTPPMIEQCMAGRAVVLVSLENRFRRMVATGERFAFPDQHLNELGHRTVAEEIYDGFKQSDLR